MARRPYHAHVPAAGFVLLEALITMAIVAFGLLGLAAMQVRMQTAQTESYQRAQAVLLVEDMANRLSASRANAASYVTNGAPLGTGDSQPASCSGLTGAALDRCEWSSELKGAGEKSAAAVAIGAMQGARGCIDLLSSAPAVYRVTVAWQGSGPLSAPALTCGSNLYGADTNRRAIDSLVTIANLSGP